MIHMKSETIQDKLHSFHKAFGHPTDEEYITGGNNATKALRVRLLHEEFTEVTSATFGWNFDVAFNRVHASNMSKLGEDGKPIYREDGKIMKSNMYKAPYLEDLV